uniref:N-alpha-acetyltransferase 40 n=1 Tax=Spongospora subterranea TaxID=70186 RepID=A0A0H5QLJ9_9EUKA|eukprot:CRZ02231.1 hypothetical protein [Spongospora subterranea]
MKSRMAAVTAARQCQDIFQYIPAFSQFCRSGVSLRLKYYHRCDLSPKQITWALDLTRQNMRTQYDHCGQEWKWNDKKKRAELEDHEARYIIAQDSAQDPVAFAHIRFDSEEDIPQIYVYELQLVEKVRGIRFGRMLMQTIELAGCKLSMEKVCLTVFKTNTAALNLYRSLSYVKDESDPSLHDIYDDSRYEILSKKLPINNKFAA